MTGDAGFGFQDGGLILRRQYRDLGPRGYDFRRTGFRVETPSYVSPHTVHI